MSDGFGRGRISFPKELVASLPEQAVVKPSKGSVTEVVVRKQPKVVFNRATAAAFLSRLQDTVPPKGSAHQALGEVKALIDELEEKVTQLELKLKGLR